MANFEPALEITLKNEGGFFHNEQTGEVVNRGITLTLVKGSGLCPTANEEFIKDLTEEETEEIYRRFFWDQYNIGQLEDQNLANKVFDLTVNMGPGTAVREGALSLLQQAINRCGGNCVVDAALGPHTVGEANRLSGSQLLTVYRELVKARYQQIAADDPALAGNLAGWLARLEA